MFPGHASSKWVLGCLAALSVVAAGCAERDDDENAPAANAGRLESSEAPPAPLAAPAGQWTWFDVPGTVCGNGTETGLGVNWGTGDEVVIFIEGGGGCWDELTCDSLKTADHLSGYGAEQFAHSFKNPDRAPSYAAPLTVHGTFDRTWELNPFKDASYVYIPYCTGDIFAGDATKKFSKRTMHFEGRKNIEAYIPKIVESFPKAKRVTLTGRSGGGFGAGINFWRFQDGFGSIPVDLIDDSGPPFPQSKIPLYNTWKAAWNMEGVFPPDCPECLKNIANLAPYYSAKYPSSRFALLSYDNDPVIGLFYFQPYGFFQKTLNDLAFNVLRPLPNFRYFTPAGVTHTMSHNWDVKAGKLALSQFINDMHSGSPSWSNKTSTGVTCPADDGTASGSAEGKYLELGACGSVLGAPTSTELVTPDLLGRYTHFQNGSIYYHPRTGSHEVHGDIRELWQSLGWERSPLGYPTTDEIDALVSGVRKSTFENGEIYKTAAGTFAVAGHIYARYASLGAEAGALGLPTTGAIPTSVFGVDRIQRFEHGSIYWTRLTNATSVSIKN